MGCITCEYWILDIVRWKKLHRTKSQSVLPSLVARLLPGLFHLLLLPVKVKVKKGFKWLTRESESEKVTCLTEIENRTCWLPPPSLPPYCSTHQPESEIFPLCTIDWQSLAIQSPVHRGPTNAPQENVSPWKKKKKVGMFVKNVDLVKTFVSSSLWL